MAFLAEVPSQSRLNASASDLFPTFLHLPHGPQPDLQESTGFGSSKPSSYGTSTSANTSDRPYGQAASDAANRAGQYASDTAEAGRRQVAGTGQGIRDSVTAGDGTAPTWTDQAAEAASRSAQAAQQYAGAAADAVRDYARSATDAVNRQTGPTYVGPNTAQVS